MRITILIALILSTATSCALASDDNLKDGWSTLQVMALAEGCVQAIMIPARRDFANAAMRAGDTKAQFPEQELHSSVKDMCSCIGSRAAATWSFQEFTANAKTYNQSLVQEALKGGQCKPTGFLGKMLDIATKKSST